MRPKPSAGARGSRQKALATLAVVYLLATGVAVAVGFGLSDQHPLVVIGIADLAATGVVFLFSLRFNNTSLYDPYWSVAPPLIAGYLILGPATPEVPAARQLVVWGLVCLWAVRLTYNFLRGWGGLSHEDWRYRDVRRWSGRFYWPVSLVALQAMPTLVVFGACLPLYLALAVFATPLSWLDAVAAATSVAAIWIEATADRQLRDFVLQNDTKEKILKRGLWAWSRHPNYFGELLFWWGLFLFALAASPSAWWTAVGPIGMVLLFVFVSVPLIDRRMLARRPGYRDHMRRVSAIIPLPPRARNRLAD